MHNPFAKPHNPEQWVLSSVCWTMACLAGWLALTWPFLQNPLLYEYKKYEPTLLFIAFAGPYVAAWMKATPPGFAFESRVVFVNLCVILWTLVLFVVLMGWLLAALFILAFSGPSTGLGF